tara:strand:- start:708 stop:1037 length:330 start_codon:yes stop_codon:yes gene_type:complete
MKGYTATNATAAKERMMVLSFVIKTKQKLISDSSAKQRKASFLVNDPKTKGRRWVLPTFPSIVWSAKSFTQHPAERMSAVPTTKMNSNENRGKPSSAIHSAEIVGQSSR